MRTRRLQSYKRKVIKNRVFGGRSNGGDGYLCGTDIIEEASSVLGLIHELGTFRKTDSFRKIDNSTERDHPDVPSILGHEDGAESFTGPCEMKQIKGAQKLGDLPNGVGAA